MLARYINDRENKRGDKRMSKGKGLNGYLRFLKGDNAALEDTVRIYSDALVRFAYCYVKNSATAEDIMEDAFVKLLVKRKTFTEEEQLRAYLYKIVRNRCLDYLRAQKRLLSLDDYAEKLMGAGLENTLEKRERHRQVCVALEKLPKDYKEILLLSYFNGFSVVELCNGLGKTQKQVYNLLARAKKALGKQLKKEGFSYEDL